MTKFKIHSCKGFSLLELLVVIGIFSILATVSTQIVAQSLRGTRKSEATIEVKENVDYIFAVVERVLRNSQSLDCGSSTNKKIVFIDENGDNSEFECHNGENGHLSYNGDNISGDDISVDCSETPVFVCTQTDGTSPSAVEINIVANEKVDAGKEGARITSSTKIILRTF